MMQVTCPCGKLLNVPDTLAGRNVRCPACNKVFKAEGVVAPATPPGKIAFDCSCGRKLTAPVSAAGRKIACPACNKELMVPAPPAAKKPAAPKPAAAKIPSHASNDDEDDDGGLYEVSKPHCPNCKAVLDSNAQFCIQCGTSLATGSKFQQIEAKPSSPKSADDSSKTKMMIYIGIGVAVVVLLIGGWMLLGKKKPAAPVGRSTTSTTAASTGTSVTDYVALVVQQPEAVQIKMDLISVQQSLEAFKGTSGRLPKNLEELENAGYPLPKLPERQQYDYNPKTGEISVWELPEEAQ